MAQEINIQSPKIDNLVRQIRDGEIKIPPLQRPFVWKTEQIIDLIESIYKEYPIGSILLWETSDELPSTRNIAGFKLPKKSDSHPFYYVLDGQQRLSSLYGVFTDDRTQELGIDADYHVDTSVFDIAFDFKNKSFIPYSEKVEGEHYFNLKSLFDTSNFLDEIAPLTEENRVLAKDLLRRLSNYEVPGIITRKRDLKEVGVIFERVNNTGKKLDLFDLMVAVTWSQNFHLNEEFKKIHTSLKEKHFEGIKNKILLQCISVIINKSSRTANITSLQQTDVQSNIEKLHESLKRTVDYLSTELSVKTIKLLPHAHQIVPLCFFFANKPFPDQNEKKVIQEWFLKTSFSNRYSASTDAHIDEDVAAFDDLIKNKNTGVFRRMSYTVTAEQLKNVKMVGTNPFARAFVVLLAHKQPLNLVNGARIDCGIALSSFNRKEYHHVFPQAFLERQGSWSKNQINSLCNFCILPAASNKLISDKRPSLYFEQDVPKESLNNILESNLLPKNIKIYEENNYANFLEERARIFINYLDSLII